MGFFNELGRRVETLKRTAENAAGETMGYRCRSCDERFDVQHEPCPDCGGELVAVSE